MIDRARRNIVPLQAWPVPRCAVRGAAKCLKPQDHTAYWVTVRHRTQDLVYSPLPKDALLGGPMPNDELLALLKKARAVLDRYMFDDDQLLRDDVADICMKIDDALPQEGRVEYRKVALELDRSAA